jgi:hypothetical protein
MSVTYLDQHRKVQTERDIAAVLALAETCDSAVAAQALRSLAQAYTLLGARHDSYS